MLDKLKQLDNRYSELGQRMENGEIYADPTAYTKCAREMKELEPIVTAYREYVKCEKAMKDAEELMSDPEFKELAQEEYNDAKQRLGELGEQLKILLLPKNPNDERNVIMEIRSGVGGEESSLFAHDLFRMYSKYAEKRGWKLEVNDETPGTAGGYKQIVFKLSSNDEGVYGIMKYESGVHRVQRVPQTETQGRIQTSAASVAVFPEAGEFDVDLKWDDIRLDLFCSSGPGGQGVNTTYSAVRLTHLPTGLVVQCQEERSQLKNKDRAFEELRTRLYNLEHQKYLDEIGAKRKTMVSTGDRSAKIRTYNYPQGRVTDHRINLTLYKLPVFMDGDIQECINQLQIAENAERLKEAAE